MQHQDSYIVVKEFTDNGKKTREVIATGVTKQGFIDAYTEKGCVMRGGENPHFEDIYSGVVYKLENHFEQGGRLNTYEDLSKEMPSVINENSTCIPIVDLALENSNDYGSFLSEKITSSNDVKEAVDKILRRISGLENQDLTLTLLLSQNNKVKGYLFSYGSNPIEKNADKQDFFRQIVSTLPAGIISVVVGNTEKSNTNEWNYFSNGISKELSFFEIRNLDTLFYDYFGSKNSVSFADSGKMRSGGFVANSYPDLSKEMPSFVSEIDKGFSQNNKISLVKKDKFCGEIPNKIERSFQAAKLFYSAWNKQKIGAVEEMFVLLLTATGRIISLYKHSLGARAGTILDNTIVSAVAVQSKAKGVIVCHNHPSGNLQPSQADIKVTRNLKEALFLCGINLVDSIIITPNENSYTSIFEEGLIMKNGGEIIYEDGGQVNRERDIQIAKTILMQLGGSNRLQMFTGAYNFVAVPNGVSFRIKNRSVNYVKIVLNAMDTYDIEFGLIRGVNYKIVKELSGIYNDQLVEVFNRYTGMVLRLRKGGAIQGEENAEMVMNQNLQIRHHTEELEEILKSGKEVPAWVVSKVSRAADSISDATHYLEGTPDKMARGGGLNRMMANKFQKASFYFKELENRMSEKQKKFFNALLKRRQPSFEKNFTDTEIANYINGEIEEQFGIDLGIKKYDITGKNWFKLGFKFIAYRESIEEPEFWEDNYIPQNIPNPEPEPEPDFNIKQLKGEIEALKELLPFLEGDDKKEVEEQIEILNITLMQNDNFGGGSEKEEIKQWYRGNYPDDDLGNELNDAVTFEDLWNVLHNGSDVYEIIGVWDSDVRENLFWRLSEIYGEDYDYVYQKWLDSDEPDAPMLVPTPTPRYAEGGGVGEIRVGSRIGFLIPHKGKYEWAEILAIEGDKVNLVIRHPKRSQWDNYFSETKERITKFTNTESNDWKDGRPLMKIKYAKGGGVGNFPPKGELKNKENLLLKYEKIGSDYEFFVYKPEKKDVSSYEQIKYVCVNKDCPTRMSYNQFLNYLYAETYLDDRKYANGGGVGELEKEIDAIYFKSGFINYDFNWRLKLLEMLQDQSIEAYNIYQKLTDKQKDDVLQEQFEMDNDMGSDGDGEMETSFENLNILLQDASNGKIYAKGGEVFVCPVGTQIQSLIFDKSMFNLRQAKAWAKKNNFENAYVDGKLNTLRIRQKDPNLFVEDGFRTIQLRQGVQAVIGCPKRKISRKK